MKRLFSRWLTPIAVCTILLSGCGSEKKDEPTPTTSSIEAPSANADVESGCWSAADRGVGVGLDARGAYQQWKRYPNTVIDADKAYTATLETSAGVITLELFPKDAPLAVNSFVCLAKAGYFDNTLFHRISHNFVIQGGDPTATGTGGPGYRFDDEPTERSYDKGTLAMANSGADTNGSQFFICTADLGLPPSYTIFGKVLNGLDVVDTLNNTPTKDNGAGEKSTPIEPVRLVTVTIAES